MGGINFTCLAVWFLTQTGLVANWDPANFSRRLGEAAASGKGSACRAPTLPLYPGICLTAKENHGNPQSG